MRLTKCEQEIMQSFWASEKPLSQAELVAQPIERSWKDRSVYILLNGLLEKGMLREAGFIRSGKTFARCFEPTVSYEEYYAHEIASHQQKLDLPKLFSALLRDDDVTEKTLSVLEHLIEEKKKELQDS